MKHTYPFCFFAALILFLSCNKKIDNPQLIKTLQEHVDSLLIKGYQIDRIDISSKRFQDYGKDDAGYLEHMFISAVSPDSTIEGLARFSRSGNLGSIITNDLTFHGYSTSPYYRRKSIHYYFKPNMVEALSRLEDVKKHIPENYKYKCLLKFNYCVIEDAQSIYEFIIELKPNYENTLNAQVKKEEISYVKSSSGTSRRKFGTSKTIHRTNVEKKIQHTITFWLEGNQIEIK